MKNIISVVIPTCNRNDLLGKCLDLLSHTNQTIHKSDYEVIVSDDSKNNIAKNFIREAFPWVKWVEGPKRGPAANRNNGVKESTGDWLLFLDDDVLPDKKLLATYKHAIMTNPESKAFEGKIIPDDWSLLKKDLSECPINIEGGFFWSANVCIEGKFFKQINGFDESYILAAHEDQQIKITIEEVTKKKIMFLEDAFVTHPVRFTTISKQIKRIPEASKNFVIYAVKNKEALKHNSALIFFVKQLNFHFRLTIKFLIVGKLKNSIVSLVHLIFLVPINLINYLILDNKTKNNDSPVV